VANGLADRFEARQGTLPATTGERYPLVLANLVASVLVEMGPRLAAHAERGASLIASGIIESRSGEVEAALAMAGFAVIEWITDGDWLTIRLERAA
jgi:ribosomal protein L11 methyltransferase